ncbi:helix-turn-helix transcriptional regulator, partial [Acinetobacter baumannii]
RTAKGLSQQALAELVGTTNQQIGHLEAGRRRLTDAWMRRLAPALDVAPPELIADGADALSLDVELLATAIESALLLTKHAQLTVR